MDADTTDSTIDHPMAPNHPTQLTLVLGYRCDLRCLYCSVPKCDEQMPIETALKAIDRLCTPEIERIRFSGTDPLVTYDTVAAILDYVKTDVKFRLVTNGVRLTDAILDRLENDSRVELVVSVDGDRPTHTNQRVAPDPSLDTYDWFEHFAPRLAKWPRPITVNLVITPESAPNLLESVQHISSNGLFRFNFLPAYYVEWQNDAIQQLHDSFAKLAAYLDEGRKRGIPFDIVNLAAYTDQALFTDGFVVDTDGHIYLSDAITLRWLSELKPRYTLGHIFDETPIEGDIERFQATLSELLEVAVPTEILASTRKSDHELTIFVNRLKPHWPHNEPA